MKVPFDKSGMTLIELMVVMALLAGLASIAVRTASTMNRRGRFDQTAALFEGLQEVVAGDGLHAGRFLRDMGRLPMMQSDTEGEELSELWLEPTNLTYETVTTNLTWDAAYSNALPAEVSMPFGWSGPYVLVTDPESKKLYDGYGNAFSVTTNESLEVIELISYGADGEAGDGANWADEDHSLDWDATVSSTDLTVTIDSTNTWDQLYIVLFTPQVSDADKSIVSTVQTNQTTCTFTDLAPMQCRVCAYGSSGNGSYASGTTAKALLLEPGQNFLTLYLRTVD
jgi:prepilin-type N-terminal cleavage/methylation domain-containing protein